MSGFHEVAYGLKSISRGMVAIARSMTSVDGFLLLVAGRGWQISFGPRKGKKGEVITIEAPAHCLFRGEKMMACDDYERVGCGTRIRSIMIGMRSQMPPGGGGTLTVFFAQNALGNGIQWKIAKPWETISMEVEFLQDCEFNCTVFGTALP